MGLTGDGVDERQLLRGLGERSLGLAREMLTHDREVEWRT